ncbi:MAG: DUF748 domain-containing protein [Gammaproteobacteria bacterium]|nr:DUF748 domain-containing protein [Gammaproteobacteria bacterium]
MSQDPALAPSPQKQPSTFRSHWLNIRRKRFWLALTVVAYTLLGFFLVPVLISHYAEKAIEETTGRDAQIADVRFNPYVLSIDVSGFELSDRDGERLVGFDRLFVNFQASSLFRWAWTFREILIDSPYLFEERDPDGDSRLARLQAEMASRRPLNSEEKKESDLPRLLVGTIAITDGGARWLDHVPARTVDIEAGPVNVTVHELNTLPGRDGRQHVSVGLPGGARLDWDGTLVLQPFHSAGNISLSGGRMNLASAYLEAMLPLSKVAGMADLETAYRLSLDENGQLSARLENLQGKLSGFSLTGLEPTTDFLAVDRIELNDGSLSYPEHRIEIGSIEVGSPELTAWRDKEGQFSFEQLATADTVIEAKATTSNENSAAWDIRIREVRVKNGAMGWEDRSTEPVAAVALGDLELSLNDVSNQDNEQISVRSSLAFEGGGRAGFEGELIALPGFSLQGRLELAELPLSLGQPYLQQRLTVAIEDGALTTGLDLQVQADGAASAVGELEITALELRNTQEDESLLAWQQMKIDRYEVDSANATVRLSAVRFEQPYGRIRINKDLSSNLDGLVLEPEAAPDPTSKNGEEAELSLLVGGITVSEGAMDFSDLSLPLPFETQVSSMEGTVSTIDSQSVEPANIQLEGQVDEFGLARIEGSMDLLDPIRHTDVSVEFRNLLMTNLSPYSAAFAGREIDEGKLDLDLLYRIKDGQLAGQNDIVLSDFKLGGKVDSPDAVSLPLDLAVALLKNSDGVIDIELPVEGDVNDPEFRIGGVVWKAFSTLITKIVTAPFKLLGNLIGVDSEDFGQFQFLAGRHDLTPPEMEKISQLLKALVQRPNLAVDVSGVYDPVVDTPVLQYGKLRSLVFERMGRDPTVEAEKDELLSDEIRNVLESLFVEQFPEISLEQIRSGFSAPPLDDPEGDEVLDELAYAGELRDRLVDAQSVDPGQLQELARQRAQAVYDAFLANGSLDPARIRLSDPEETKSEDGEWVVMELGVADAP